MNRREFLGLLGKGAVVVGAGGLIVPAARKIWQVPVQLKPSKMAESIGNYAKNERLIWDGDFIDFGDGDVITPKTLDRAIADMAHTYGQPTDCFVSSQTYESLKSDIVIGEVGRAKYLMENNTYSLMKRMHRELYSGNSKA